MIERYSVVATFTRNGHACLEEHVPEYFRKYLTSTVVHGSCLDQKLDRLG